MVKNLAPIAKDKVNGLNGKASALIIKYLASNKLALLGKRYDEGKITEKDLVYNVYSLKTSKDIHNIAYVGAIINSDKLVQTAIREATRRMESVY